MAQLAAGNQSSILKIREFLGLNENPDGDTHLKPGEFSRLQNFRITRDRHLQLRPGQRTVLDLRDAWEALAKKPAGVAAGNGWRSAPCAGGLRRRDLGDAAGRSARPGGGAMHTG